MALSEHDMPAFADWKKKHYENETKANGETWPLTSAVYAVYTYVDAHRKAVTKSLVIGFMRISITAKLSSSIYLLMLDHPLTVSGLCHAVTCTFDN